MPSQNDAIKLTITARNEASAELQRLSGDVERLKQSMMVVANATDANSRSFREGRQAVGDYSRLLAQDFTQAADAAVGASGRLSSGLQILTNLLGGSVAGAVSGFVTIVGQHLVESYRKAAEEQERWSEAMRGSIGTDIPALNKAIEQQTKLVKELGAALVITSQAAANFPTPTFQEFPDLGTGAGDVGARQRALDARIRLYIQSQDRLAALDADRQAQLALGAGEIGAPVESARDQIRRAAEQRRAAEEARRYIERAIQAGQEADTRVQEEAGRYTSIYGMRERADVERGQAQQQKEEFESLKQGLAFWEEINKLVLKYYDTIEARDKEAARAEEKAFRERAKHAEELQKYLEETDFFAGLEKGFRDVSRGSGAIMQDFARDTARGMKQSFDDLFFNALTGNFKKMSDFGRQAGAALARAFSGALSDALISPATRGLAGLLGGGYRGLVPVAAAGGGTALVPGTAAAYGGAAPIGAGTQGGLLDLLVGATGGLGQSVSQYLGFGASAASGLSASAYGGAENLAALAGIEGAGVDIGGYAGGLAPGLGAGIGSVLGYVGAGVGALAALYAAYQTRSPAAGALTGAISGLTIGLSAGSAISLGWGSLIGLVVGAAAGAGAGALGGKGGRRSVGSERRSAQAAQSAITNFASALNQAETSEQLLGVLNTPWAPNDEFLIRATAGDGTPRNRNFTEGDLYDPKILESITVYVGVTGSTQFSFELTQGLKAKMTQIAQSEGGVLFAQREVAPGVSRTTYLPFSAVARGAGAGQPFYYSTEDARNRGASPEQIAALLRYLRSLNGFTDLIPDWTAERFLQV